MAMSLLRAGWPGGQDLPTSGDEVDRDVLDRVRQFGPGERRRLHGLERLGRLEVLGERRLEVGRGRRGQQVAVGFEPGARIVLLGRFGRCTTTRAAAEVEVVEPSDLVLDVVRR